LGLSIESVLLNCDNQSTLELLKHPIASVRSKHIDVVHHFARERVMRGEVVFQYCATEDMVADCLTKALAAVKFNKLRAIMGVG
jgi:hypothetical protein